MNEPVSVETVWARTVMEGQVLAVFGKFKVVDAITRRKEYVDSPNWTRGRVQIERAYVRFAWHNEDRTAGGWSDADSGWLDAKASVLRCVGLQRETMRA